MENVLTDKVIKNVDLILNKKNTDKIHVLVSAVLIKDMNNYPESVLAMIQDITSIKNTEKQLMISRQNYKEQALRLQALLDIAPAIIWIALDKNCKNIIGNNESYKFLNAKYGINVSKTSDKDLLKNYQMIENGKKLTPQNMPIQRVAFSGKPLYDYEVDFIFTNGIKKH